MKILNFSLCIVMLSILMHSCTKSASTTYPYSVRLTDAPGAYSAVNIDLKAVEITGTGGKTVMLNVDSGILNLLNYSNGLDTLIATATLEAATVEQIRLILGTNNTVVVDNVSYPLSTPSAEQSGLKLQVHQTLKAGVQNSILLDFDANKSIVSTGSGTYKLKPVIRTIEVSISGSIKGKIAPLGTLASITATSSTSYSSFVNANGEFLLMGLPAGTYSLTITPVSSLINPISLNNISVSVGSTTNVGTIVF